MTVERFVKRYTIDREHAARVAALATGLYRRALGRPGAGNLQLLGWAATLHEIGMSVSHIGFHKHGAYILQHADMPGFSAGEQGRLALLVFGCRGGLAKVGPALADDDARVQLLALRLAVLFHHARAALALPRIRLRWRPFCRCLVSAKERSQWDALRYPWKAARD